MANRLFGVFNSSEQKQNEEIEFIRKRVLRKFPLLGTVMVDVKLIADDRVGRAGTNGKEILWSPKYFESLNDSEKMFVLAHEYMHIAYDHILRSKERDKELWNYATDGVINQILIKEGLQMTDDGVDIKQAINYSAEELYEKLLNQQKQENNSQQQQQQQSGQGQDGDSSQQQQSGQGQDGDSSQQQQSGQGQSGDSSQQQQQSGQGQSGDSSQQQQQSGQGQSGDSSQQQQQSEQGQDGDSSQQQGSQSSSSSMGQGEINNSSRNFRKETGQSDEKIDLSKHTNPKNHNLWEKAVLENERKTYRDGNKSDNSQSEENPEQSEFSKGEKHFLEENNRLREDKIRSIRETLKQEKNRILSEKSSDATTFGAVGKSAAVVNWKKLLREDFEKHEDQWSYRRSNADNDYMPRVEEMPEEEPETEVMLDVSGSVDAELLREFLRQLKPILKNSKMKVGCFDHRLFEFQEIKTDKDIDNFKIVGGGGTNLDLAVRAFSKKKDVNKIVFTDGESWDMPKQDLKNVNVIWLIYDNDNFNPVCGKVIKVDRRQIKNNHNYASLNKSKGSRSF